VKGEDILLLGRLQREHSRRGWSARRWTPA